MRTGSASHTHTHTYTQHSHKHRQAHAQGHMIPDHVFTTLSKFAYEYTTSDRVHDTCSVHHCQPPDLPAPTSHTNTTSLPLPHLLRPLFHISSFVYLIYSSGSILFSMYPCFLSWSCSSSHTVRLHRASSTTHTTPSLLHPFHILFLLFRQ